MNRRARDVVPHRVLRTPPTRLLLDEVPTREFTTLTHVGTLNPQEKTNRSYEGTGLSVSVHPDEWSWIARLPGDQWELSTTTGDPFVLLDAHALHRAHWAALHQWGSDNGWIRKGFVWETPHLNEETGVEERVVSRSLDDALVEMELEGVDAGGGSRWPRRRFRWLPTKAFPDPLVHWLDADPLLLTLWASCRADLHGVWWEDIYDPDALSCPRGVLHAPCVARRAR